MPGRAVSRRCGFRVDKLGAVKLNRGSNSVGPYLLPQAGPPCTYQFETGGGHEVTWAAAASAAAAAAVAAGAVVVLRWMHEEEEWGWAWSARA
jgi:hypothetical protein